MGLLEVSQAAEEIETSAHPNANIIFGTVIDDEMDENVRVTVIATGFDRWDSERTRKPSREFFRGFTDKDEDVLKDVFGDDFDDEDGLEVPDFLK